MNPYSSPNSNIQHSDTKAPGIPVSIIIAIVSVPAIYMIVFPIVGLVKSFLYMAGFIGGFESRLIIDAILSFLALAAYFTMIFRIRKLHARYICLFCGTAMLVYWGYESDFFWNGFNTMYPLWYEINMAFNDLMAAILIIYLHRRTVNQDTENMKVEPDQNVS